MADGYTKLFADIVDSSIWTEDSDTKVVWVTLLALCNADGFVRGSPGWLASKARVSVEVCNRALDKFKKPDPSSRTPDNDGRRLEQLDDGWLVLNYLLFRDRLSSSPKAVKTRERVRKHRERYQALRNDESVTRDHPASASESESVGKGNAKGKGFRKPSMEEVKLAAAKSGLPDDQAEAFWHFYESKGWLVGKSPMKSWVSALAGWNTRWRAGHFSSNGKAAQLTKEQEREAEHLEMRRACGGI